MTTHADARDQRIRVLTYNIHKGIGGVDRRYQIDRIVAILRHYDADVCMLQEVDHGAKRSRYEHQSELLAEALDMPHFGIGINHHLRRPGAYGNVTLSRLPIARSFNLNITQRFKKRRGALYTQLVTPGGATMHTFNFHLGLAHYERIAQVRRILQAPAIRNGDIEPTIIGGDSNDWQGRLCRQVLEPKGFSEVGTSLRGRRTPTFPAWQPILPLDRLYYRGVRPVDIVDEDHQHLRHASDHRPLAVDFAVDHGTGQDDTADASLHLQQ